MSIDGWSAGSSSAAAQSSPARARYADLPDGKIHAILNGYDEADFSGLTMDATPRGRRLRIVHAGSVNPEFRDPRPLLSALANLIREGKLAASECEIVFIGGGPFGDSLEVSDAVVRSGLRDAVSFLPRVPYEESLRRLASADLLLLLQASDDTVGLVPAKLYEYLRTQKPTLALVRVGAVSEVMARTGGGWCVDPADGHALATVLAEIVREWRVQHLAEHRADLEILRLFDRRALTGELADILQRVCQEYEAATSI
jgi:glycosyltransferase involved in cell wall biosynthesis